MSAADKWRKRAWPFLNDLLVKAAVWTTNRYFAAQWLYLASESNIAFSWERMKQHWRLFK